MSKPQFLPVMSLADLAEGSVVAHKVGTTPILLCQSKGTVFAIAEMCSHADESLACGRMRHGWIACPAHGARFDLATGRPMNPPATAPIATYAVRVIDGLIEVQI